MLTTNFSIETLRYAEIEHSDCMLPSFNELAFIIFSKICSCHWLLRQNVAVIYDGNKLFCRIDVCYKIEFLYFIMKKVLPYRNASTNLVTFKLLF